MDGLPNGLTAKAFNVTTTAAGFCALNLCLALVEKRLLTPAEAAQVMTKTADDIRNGSEDDALAGYGEALARGYERFAATLLRSRGSKS